MRPGWRPGSSSRAATRRASNGSAGRDPDALMKQAEAAFERVVEELADVPGPHDQTLGQEAQFELNEIRDLIPIKPAPEVTGTDFNGRPMKLSDRRGRVILLSFWGKNWGSVRGQIPLRAGAGGADARPAVRPARRQRRRQGDAPGVIKKEDITWPSWWDRGHNANTPGPIARQFNVNTRPTYYLIDHRGVIRHKFRGTPGPGKLDAAIDELVAAAERDAAPGPLERRGPRIYGRTLARKRLT